MATTLNIGLGIYFLWRDGLFSRPLFRVLAPGLLLLPLAVSRLPAWDVALLNSAPYLYAGQYQSAATLTGQGVAHAIGQGRRLLYAEEGMTATVPAWDLRGERFMRVNGKVVASSQGKDSTDARVWNNLGTAFLKQRQFAEAQHYLSGAIKRRPEDATLWLKLADAYRGTGEVEKARQVLAEAPADQRVRKMREQLGE